MRVVYLHGFASSARSTKATFFAEKLAAKGIEMSVPDLNQPDFSTLTVTRMLKQAGDAIDAAGEPVALIGSSLGGFVAVQAAVEHAARVQRIVLLAPALDFDGNRLSELGDRGLDEWKIVEPARRVPLRVWPHDAGSVRALCRRPPLQCLRRPSYAAGAGVSGPPGLVCRP